MIAGALYWIYRIRLLRHWNREYRTVLNFEIAPDLLCPIVVIVRYGLRGTWSMGFPSIECSLSNWVGPLADGLTFERKSMPMVAWYMLSNESYMNRVIKDVLPTVLFHLVSEKGRVAVIKIIGLKIAFSIVD